LALARAHDQRPRSRLGALIQRISLELQRSGPRAGHLGLLRYWSILQKLVSHRAPKLPTQPWRILEWLRFIRQRQDFSTVGVGWRNRVASCSWRSLALFLL
jgi:hypothetical protein